MTPNPSKTYNNPTDGHTYFLAPMEGRQGDVLWACPTNADDTPDLECTMPVETFEAPLSDQEREKIMRALQS